MQAFKGAWDHAGQGPHRHALDGIRTPVGIKVFGKDLREITKINDQLEACCARSPARAASMQNVSLVASSSTSHRPPGIARYGLTVRDVLDVVESSIGGMDVDHHFRRS
jgi:Cu(I)/Ag(I) efflux system membrane protein CusA/SilA